MTTLRILLGHSKEHGPLNLYIHEWACKWYWSFGHIGNRNLHMHMRALIDHPKDRNVANWTDVSHHFTDTWITQQDWWIIRDVFIQAYAFQAAAEAYRNGGHQTTYTIPKPVRSDTMVWRINHDLSVLLDNFWDWLVDTKLRRQLEARKRKSIENRRPEWTLSLPT